MSVLARAVALKQLKLIGRSFSLSSAKGSAYNYNDYKPDPKPKTREEFEKAAKKYGLHPSEYEPYQDDDGLGRGDYPKLPNVSVETRDPYYPWDSPELKRNFGEPVHAEIDLISEDRWNVSLQHRYTNAQRIGIFLGIMTFFYTVYLLTEPYPLFRPVMEKQLPEPGKVHYTFETRDSSGIAAESD